MTLKQAKEALALEFKKVLKTNLSKIPNTLARYEQNLIIKYNNYIKEILKIYENLSEANQNFIQLEVNKTNEKLNNCFVALNSTHRSPDIFLAIIEHEEVIMALTNTELLKIASQSLNFKYSGDALQLESFIDAINLINSFATTDGLRTFLFAYVKSKLEGVAREHITIEITTVDALIERLRSKIKADNSQVIEGRILSLKLNKNDTADFAKKAEDLSDAFKRSLIIEGVSASKAEQMAINKTVELCRNSTGSDIVKAVIAASKFESSKEVLAKWITESSVNNKDKQILTFRQSSVKRYNNRAPDARQNSNFRGFRPQNNYNNNRYNNNNRNKYQNNNYRYNNNRGRGQNNRHTQNNRFVRAINASGNSESPQTQTLGDAQ